MRAATAAPAAPAKSTAAAAAPHHARRRSPRAPRAAPPAGAQGGAPEASGGCPVLGRLPPRAPRPWWSELNFWAPHLKVQAEILNGGPVGLGRYLLFETALVGDADLARSLLACEGDAWTVSNPPHLEKILGSESLGVVGEPQHMKLRRLMAPALSAESVGSYVPEIAAAAEAYCARWAAAGRVPALHDELKLFTFEVICRVVCGIRFGPGELEEWSALYGDVAAGLAFPLPLELPFTPFGRAMAARREVEARLRARVAEARAALARGGGAAQKAGGMLAALVAARDPETGEGLTDQQLTDNLIGLLIAGHDTTASTLSVVMYYLHKHPEVMAALREEQASVAAAHGPALTPAALDAMPYANAVTREAWRLRPVVPIVGREALRDVAVGEYTLPAGHPAWPALGHIQHNDPRWAGAAGDLDPARFNPSRWLTPEGAAQGAQLVFGAGKRSCLGASLAQADIRAFLAVLARGYSFELDESSVRWREKPFPVAQADCARFAALA